MVHIKVAHDNFHQLALILCIYGERVVNMCMHYIPQCFEAGDIYLGLHYRWKYVQHGSRELSKEVYENE